ncbi:hypothetical protein ABT095_14805 [Kitasatospora sp. NPDC002227]|uniref:hypothetical protein n=1 Tax=Kitasatospora sp. NPDC002227 TaxID=3154773 RepID=UPI00332E8553
MALIVVCSAKGSPGASTTALALAAEWPRQSLLAELDPLGGDLVYRQGAEDGSVLDPNRGMNSLALAGRGGITPELVHEHSQRLPGGLDVLVGLTRPEQTNGWSGRWTALGRALAAPGTTDVIADIGRAHPGSPVNELLPYASLVLVVSRTTAEDLAHLRSRVASLHNVLSPAGRSGAPVGVLLIAPARQQAAAARDAAQVLAAGQVPAQVAGVIAFDPKAAEQLAGRRRGRIHRTQLVASVRQTIGSLGTQFGLGRVPEQAVTENESAEGVLQ